VVLLYVIMAEAEFARQQRVNVMQRTNVIAARTKGASSHLYSISTTIADPLSTASRLTEATLDTRTRAVVRPPTFVQPGGSKHASE
jgi:hypothetical protein